MDIFRRKSTAYSLLCYFSMRSSGVAIVGQSGAVLEGAWNGSEGGALAHPSGAPFKTDCCASQGIPLICREPWGLWRSVRTWKHPHAAWNDTSHSLINHMRTRPSMFQEAWYPGGLSEEHHKRSHLSSKLPAISWRDILAPLRQQWML